MFYFLFSAIYCPTQMTMPEQLVLVKLSHDAVARVLRKTPTEIKTLKKRVMLIGNIGIRRDLALKHYFPQWPTFIN